MSQLTFENGGVQGLESQVDRLKETDPYLFDGSPIITGFQSIARYGTSGQSAGNPFRKETLNLTEQGRLFKEDRNQYEQLKRAAGLN